MRDKIFHILIFSLLICACKQANKLQRVSDAPILAEVGNSTLYLDELENSGLLTNASNSYDSTHIKNIYVQKWIRDQLILIDADKTLAGDIDIDMLVQDYRESLLLYNYENAMVRDRLDTVITTQQIEQYYKENGDAFKLSESLIRCKIAVLNGRTPKLDIFITNWKSSNIKSVNTYLAANSPVMAMMDEYKWYSANEILGFLPDKIKEKNLRSSKILQEAKDGNEYFVDILQYLDKSEVPPLAYVTSNIKKIILHQRKSKLIVKLKEDLYQREINSTKVRIY
ncbi:MAG: hypothetical protein P8H42_03925 [Saprospiraceae bacterium]|nr:hypothetical protein [Saprospiraceae bacterium]